MKHITGSILLFLGGICMIISSAIGSIGIYEFLYDYISTEVPSEFIPILKVTIEVLRIISYTGGFAVIVGTIFILLSHYRLGKFFIGLGLTFGLLGLIIWIISEIVDISGIVTDPQVLAYLDRLEGFFTYNTGLAFTGVTLSVIGRMLIKKPKEPKKPKKVKQEVKLGADEEIFEESEEI